LSDPIARSFAEEIVEKLVEDAQWVSNFSHQASNGGFPELGFSHTLTGVAEGMRGFLVLAPDATVGPLEPYCSRDVAEPGIWKERDSCLRLRRLSESDWAADVYFTMRPRREADDRHPFSYETADGQGTMMFDPNPLVAWIVGFGEAGAASVTAVVQRDMVFARSAAQPLDLSHSASLSVHHENPSMTVDHFEFVFPGLAVAGNITVRLDVRNVEPFTAQGWVLLGEDVLGQIGGTAFDLAFAWH
jgi:hypothetical protein